MTEIIKETITTKQPLAGESQASNLQTTEYIIYFIFGFLEVLLSFRLLLKLAGASMASGFVRFIYGFTGIFIMPFEGIFRRGYSQGVETASVLEPSVIVAFIVYILLAWGIVKLLHISSGEQQES